MMQPACDTAPADGVSGQAVMDAFRVLRADDAVHRLQPGSAGRRTRIRELLAPIAADEGRSVQDVARALADAMSGRVLPTD